MLAVRELDGAHSRWGGPSAGLSLLNLTLISSRNPPHSPKMMVAEMSVHPGPVQQTRRINQHIMYPGLPGTVQLLPHKIMSRPPCRQRVLAAPTQGRSPSLVTHCSCARCQDRHLGRKGLLMAPLRGLHSGCARSWGTHTHPRYCSLCVAIAMGVRCYGVTLTCISAIPAELQHLLILLCTEVSFLGGLPVFWCILSFPRGVAEVSRTHETVAPGLH